MIIFLRGAILPAAQTAFRIHFTSPVNEEDEIDQ
jgi:hypothetical protein